MAETKLVTMDDILKASLGEASSNIRANFKKTVNIRQYETEVFEASSTLEIDKPLSGVERMLLSAILQAQLEYEVYVQMAYKQIVTGSELATRKAELENDVNAIKAKGEQLLGKPLDYLFEMTV